MYVQEYDVTIVGSGIVGLMTAYNLAHYKAKALVLEANSEPGWGVSKAHAAIIHVVQLPFNSLKSRMAREGNKKMFQIAERLGVRYVRTSTLVVATKIHHLLALPFIAFYLRLNLGRDFPVKIRGRSYLRRVEPNLTKKALGAIEIQGYGCIDNFDLLYGLYEFASANGVEFKFNERVVSLKLGEESISVYTDKGSVYRTKFLVNAGGLWADELYNMLDGKVEFELGKGVMLVFDRKITNHFVAPLYLKPDPKTKGGAIMFTVDGRGLWGPNLRPARDKYDVSVEEEDVKALMKKFLPLLESSPGIPIKAYAGIRPIPPENDFRITYSSVTNRVIHVVGTESPAFTASPAIAEKIVEMLQQAGLKLEKKDRVVERAPFRRLRDNPRAGKGRVICVCNLVTEEEVREAVRRGSRTLQGVMFRTGAGMGLCQGGKCIAEVARVIADELGVDVSEITLRGGDSWLVKRK